MSKKKKTAEGSSELDLARLQLKEALQCNECLLVEKDTAKKELEALAHENSTIRKLFEQERAQELQMKQLLQDECNSVEEEKIHLEKITSKQIDQLKLDLGSQAILLTENTQLSQRVNSLMEQLSELSKEHAKEMGDMKRDFVQTQLKLESTFRKSLADIDRRNAQAAFENMNQESKNALLERARVEDELSLQKVGIKFIEAKYSNQCKSLKQKKIDNDILTDQQNIQSKTVATLRMQNKRFEGLLEENHIELRELKLNLSKSEEKQGKLKGLEIENMDLKADLEATKEKASKYKECYLKLVERVESEKNSFEYPVVDIAIALVPLANKKNKHKVVDLKTFDRTKFMTKTKDSASMPLLKQCHYNGILESWKVATVHEIQESASHAGLLK